MTGIYSIRLSLFGIARPRWRREREGVAGKYGMEERERKIGGRTESQTLAHLGPRFPNRAKGPAIGVGSAFPIHHPHTQPGRRAL